MEIEAKYAIVGPLAPADLEALKLEPYRLRPATIRVQQDVILDTAGRAITGSRHGLRLRHIEGNVIATLKGGGQVTDGIHEREELEVELGAVPPDLELDAARWPSPLRERVASLIGAAPLLPLFEIEVRRQTWNVERAGEIIGELALDRGTITANGRSEAIWELEVEVKGAGSRADLEKIGEQLRAHLPLQPATRTKLQRGLALLAVSSRQDINSPLRSNR